MRVSGLGGLSSVPIGALAELAARYSPVLLEGVANTLVLTIASFAIGFALGLPVALGRAYGPRILRLILTAYVEAIRGTPMLLQLFLVYYALPSLGIVLNPLEAAIIGIGLNSSAYQAEYLRASIRAVATSQWEAALSLGMTHWQAVAYIVVPQALRFSIPSLSNELISLLQYSSIAYFLTVVELVYAGKIIGSETFAYPEAYTIVAAIYLALALVIARVARLVERKTAIPGLLAHAR